MKEITIDQLELRELMALPQFRRFIQRRLQSAGVLRSVYTDNAMRMAFAEGARNEGLKLLAELTAADAERCNQLLREHQTGEPDDDEIVDDFADL